MPKPRKKLSYNPTLTEVSKYCIFWIPCVFHTDLSILKGQEIQKQEFITRQNFKFKVKSEAAINQEIDSWDGKIIINLKFIEITESDPEFKKNINVRLVSKDFRRNGLIKFEYSLTPEQHGLFDDMRDQTYSLIKKHFHIHEFHTYFTSVKNGYYKDVDLCTADNDAIVWYINQFYIILQEQLKQIEYDYKWLELNKTNYSPELNEARYEFYESCENVFGQLVYHHSILNSRWNRSCRLTPTTDTPNEDLTRLAHNYYNLISKLQYIYQRSRTFFYLSNIHENIDNQRKISDVLKNSKTSNIISLILGFVSVLMGGLSLFYYFQDKKQTQDIVKDQPANSIVSSNETISETDNNFARLDTLLDNLMKETEDLSKSTNTKDE